ncbi:hypothetical protein H312_00073 [Anncaliia algerae PRA339]|uniref:Vacuolar import/degradation Vid27 C-terminal domain-containing protein n=1 Tax=Anncaliia algerae PRA339 TaxID=1288291 RepID=A0A059F5E0_9MICR|nr:hypothetical protein H312_00073 [Anncaliia algerae PRA339]
MFPFLRLNSRDGELYHGSVKIFECSYKITKETLFFISKEEERSFQINKMYNLELNNKTLSFSYFSDDYNFKSKGKIDDLFNNLSKSVERDKKFECIVNLSRYELGRFIKEGEQPLVIKGDNIVLEDKLIEIKEIVDLYFEKKDSSVILSYLDKDKKKEETIAILFNDYFILLKFLSYVKFNKSEEIIDNKSEEEEEESDVPEEKLPNKTKDGIKNDGLLVGKNNLLFVSRGEALGIFSTEKDLEFRETITNALEDSLSKMKLYNNNLLLQDKDNTTLKVLDLNKQEIVEKRDTKNQLTDFFTEKDFLGGVTENSILNFDFRNKDLIVNKKEYKTKPMFTVGNVKKNNIVIGSTNGDIRFYDSIGKKAKELIKGYGSKPIYVDLFDKYTLVTFKEYIILFYDKKQVKLSLKQSHIEFLKGEINFTPCKFSSDGERIVTSTNNYVIVWKMSDILSDKLMSYRIKHFNDSVIANTFSEGDSNTILLALPDDVKKTGTNTLWSLDKEIYKRK